MRRGRAGRATASSAPGRWWLRRARGSLVRACDLRMPAHGLADTRGIGLTLRKVSLEGWIFMVGLRVFDVGALVVWLVWFFRLRDDDDDGEDDGRRGKGGGSEPEEPTGPGGLRLPLP